MIEIKSSKILTYITNFFLLIFQLPQLITGLIGLAIFHNYEWYTNEYSGIKVLKVNKGNFIGGACFSSGPIIFVTPNCDEEIVKHETGHSFQSIILGPLFHVIISITSICLFWYKKLTHKDKKWYYQHFPENWANSLGGVDVSKYGL